METSSFEVAWVDETGYPRREIVVAPDAESAVRAYRYAHPEAREKILRCRPAGENGRARRA